MDMEPLKMASAMDKLASGATGARRYTAGGAGAARAKARARPKAGCH